MKQLAFLFPLDGDVLLSNVDGYEIDGRLFVPVRLHAPCGSAPIVNGILAKRDGNEYLANIPIGSGAQTITAELSEGEHTQVRVWWLKGGAKRLHFTVDDCIRCFQDLTIHSDKYPTLFSHPFLSLFWNAHKKYGMTVHINVFFESVDGSFNLSMMTDRYRNEFQANSDWLSLSFHAMREFPDNPYIDSDYDTVMHDCQVVTNEIRRFAGDEVLRQSTTLHFGAATYEGTRALRDHGYRALCGFLTLNEQGKPVVSYYLDAQRVERASHREAIVDFDEEIFFVHLDFVLDRPENAADQIEKHLNAILERENEGQFISMVIHEQYFYPDYENYRSDYADRVLTVARWAKEHDYKSVSISKLLQNNIETN